MGLAALQMTGTRSTYSAEKGSQASMLADEVIERMRANRTVARNGGYDIGFDSTPRTCDRAVCPSTPLERSDLCQWKNACAVRCRPGDASGVRAENSGDRVFAVVRSRETEAVKSRRIIDTFFEQLGLFLGPVFHRLRGRTVAQCFLRDVLIVDLNVAFDGIGQVLGGVEAGGG